MPPLPPLESTSIPVRLDAAVATRLLDFLISESGREFAWEYAGYLHPDTLKQWLKIRGRLIGTSFLLDRDLPFDETQLDDAELAEAIGFIALDIQAGLEDADYLASIERTGPLAQTEDQHIYAHDIFEFGLASETIETFLHAIEIRSESSLAGDVFSAPLTMGVSVSQGAAGSDSWVAGVTGIPVGNMTQGGQASETVETFLRAAAIQSESSLAGDAFNARITAGASVSQGAAGSDSWGSEITESMAVITQNFLFFFPAFAEVDE